MLKVYLVEDEATVREGLRDTIPWERCGYTYVGCATDGEMALPEIRRLKPDVLITDIRMPYMDGLALSQQVLLELPQTKIIIISGCNHFDCARQAIHIGVEEYILKPISTSSVVNALEEVKSKIEIEQKQLGFNKQFYNESKEYQQFSSLRFFEKLVSGYLSVREIYEEAGKLRIDINAKAYNIVLFSFNSMKNKDPEALSKVQDELNRFFQLRQKFLLFRWSFNTYAILIKDDFEVIYNSTQFCIDNICRYCRDICGIAGWNVSAGTPVERLSSLNTCFYEVTRKLSCSYFCQGEHVLTGESVARLLIDNEEQKLDNVDASKISTDAIQRFLKVGLKEEVDNFVSEYLNGFSTDTLNSKMFSRYLALNFRFTVTAHLKELNISAEGLNDVLKTPQFFSQSNSLKGYICRLLERSLELCEVATSSKYNTIIKQAIEYIRQHYTDEDISLNKTAKILNISASYFSAVFSQEVGKTFVEYLTEMRMDRAKELLRQTNKRLGEISLGVGYKDPHYFSVLFKKSENCTPREYRAGI